MTIDEETHVPAMGVGRGLGDGGANAPTDAAGSSQAGMAPAVGTPVEDERATPLLSDDLNEEFRARWQDVQADFVDDPPRAVEHADALVTEVMQRLADTFARERAGLERQWGAGGQASTEDLRIAVQRYRSFFQRLLSL